ncbi:MAG: S41 family peptidase, partial [Bacteroidota bacterium]
SVQHPELPQVPAMFPVWIKIIKEKFYVDAADHGLPLGGEILAINSITAQEILFRLLKFVPSDGDNRTRQYRGVEEQFGTLHFYEFGTSDTYAVQYRTPAGDTALANIPARAFALIGESYPERSSHFSRFHGFTDKRAFFAERVAPRGPFVYYVDSLDAAVLTVNSFGLAPQEFKSQLIDIFAQLRKKKVKHLIVDVRRNPGGYRANAISLYSFLTDQPFRQREEESTVVSVLPHKEYLVHTSSDYVQFFQKYFGNATRENNRWVLRKDHARAEMVPFRKPFRGKVYVLTGGKTFSAATAFALTAKHDPDITLIGEETGGGYHQHVGQYSAVYQLPHSKILLRIPLVHIKHYAPDESASHGRGIFPDFLMAPTVRDLIEGRDAVLAQAFALIARS